MRVYKTSVDDGDEGHSQRDLVSRWSQAATDSVREAINSGAELPRVFPPLKISYGDERAMVEDLRGLFLADMVIEDYDLAYCALDNATFERSRLVGTKLQYSRLHQANFKSAELLNVQASPIDAKGVDFSNARISSSFFSHSNLLRAKTAGLVVAESDFIEASASLNTTPHAPLPDFFVSYEDEGASKLPHKLLMTLMADGELDSLSSKSFVKSIGSMRIGTVVSSTKDGQAIVCFSSKPKTKSGRVIQNVVLHRIAGSVLAEVKYGDRVEVRQVTTMKRGSIPFTGRSDTPKPSTGAKTKSRHWLIFGRNEDSDWGAFAD